MVNTNLNSHEQNKKHTEIAKNNFRTFGENETKQEQFSRMSDLHTGPILAIYCIQLSHAINCPFSNLVRVCPNFQIFCPFFLKNRIHALTFLNRPWHYAIATSI